ncbi:MAG: hypothetical protein QM538_02390 [Methylacidiphilales bacterium]|nr:hypothetical protein [Candidatus Methylacidiphilales bacterium]
MDNALLNFIIEISKDNFAILLLFAYGMYKFKLVEFGHTSLEKKLEEMFKEIKEIRSEMAKGFKDVANDIHAVRVDIARISERQDSMHDRVQLLEDVIIRKIKTKLALSPRTTKAVRA